MSQIESVDIDYQKRINFLEPFQSDIPDWLREIKEVGIKRKVPIVDDDMGRYLKTICSLYRPENILELGCGISYATHWMLLGSPDSQIIALDYNQDRLDMCRSFLQTSGFLNQVDLRRVWAEDFFAENNNQFDLIFQDSTKKNYSNMIEACCKSLKIGGFFIVDNIFFNGKVLGLKPDQLKKYGPGVQSLKSFIAQISQHPQFDCNFFAISDGVLVAQRNS